MGLRGSAGHATDARNGEKVRRAAWRVALALAAWSTLAGAQQSVQERIIALENAWNHAVQQRDDKAVESLLGDELIYIDYDGTMMDKRAYIASVKNTPLNAEQIVSGSMRVQVYGEGAVVVGVYREKGTRNGKPYSIRERFVDTWLNRHGAWVCVASQATLITQ